MKDEYTNFWGDKYTNPWPLAIGDNIELVLKTAAGIEYESWGIVTSVGAISCIVTARTGDEKSFMLLMGSQMIALHDPVLEREPGLYWKLANATRMVMSPPPRVICVCKKCNMKNEHAEPNQNDGTYVCYNCRRYGKV